MSGDRGWTPGTSAGADVTVGAGTGASYVPAGYDYAAPAASAAAYKQAKLNNGGGDMLLAAGIMAGGSLLGSIAGGWMQNSANEKMNKQNLQLAYTQRDDLLKQNAFNNQLALGDRAFRDKQYQYQQLLDRRTEMRNKLAGNAAWRNDALNMLNAANQLNNPRRR